MKGRKDIDEVVVAQSIIKVTSGVTNETPDIS